MSDGAGCSQRNAIISPETILSRSMVQARPFPPIFAVIEANQR